MSGPVIDGILEVLQRMLPLMQETHAAVTEEPDGPSPLSEQIEALMAKIDRMATALESQDRSLTIIAEHFARQDRNGPG
jgi:hypothetical protein